VKQNEKAKPVISLQLLKEAEPIRTFSLENLQSFTVGFFFLLAQFCDLVLNFLLFFLFFCHPGIQDICALMACFLELGLLPSPPPSRPESVLTPMKLKSQEAEPAWFVTSHPPERFQTQRR